MRREDDLGHEDRDGRDTRPDDVRGDRPPPAGHSGIAPRQVLIAIFALLLIVFAVANFKPVQVNFLVFQTRARVITVVAVAGALGFLIGYLVGRPTREQRRYLRKRDDDR
jgi:uncharacterized integral membrane protein